MPGSGAPVFACASGRNTSNSLVGYVPGVPEAQRFFEAFADPSKANVRHAGGAGVVVVRGASARPLIPARPWP